MNSDVLVKEALASYHKGVEDRLEALLKATGLTTADLIFVTGNPGPRYTNRALEKFELTTMGGFVLDRKWLLKKDDFDRLNRSPSET